MILKANSFSSVVCWSSITMLFGNYSKNWSNIPYQSRSRFFGYFWSSHLNALRYALKHEDGKVFYNSRNWKQTDF